MRALVLHELSGPPGLRFEPDWPEPQSADGLVLIDVHSAGAGFVDWLVTRGEYQVRPDLPFVPGIEVAGVVREAADGAAVAAGDRVVATVAFGGFAEVAAAPAFLVFPLPDGVGMDAGGGFVINYQTAHLALARRGRLAPGETVLVHGAAGGVGTAAIQVAKALGAGAVIAIASDEAKGKAAVTAGADHFLASHGDWVSGVRELTQGRGADLVVDPVGGDAFGRSLKCMAPFGRLLVIGFASGAIPQLPVNRLLLRHLDVIGVNYGGMLPFDQGFAAAAWNDLGRWLADGTLRPLVGRRYALADGAQCLEDFAARRVIGKPVLIVKEEM